MGSRRLGELLQDYALEIEDSESMFICLECFSDDWLKKRANMLMQPRTCVACGKIVSKAQTASKIADIIRGPLQHHFVIDYGLYPGYELSLQDVIARAIGCDSVDTCNAVADLLIDKKAGEDDFYFEGQEYSKAPNRFESEEQCRWWVESDWEAISAELTHGQRFFNDKAKIFFESLIFEAMWSDKELPTGAPSAVKNIPAGSHFFRARIAKTLAEVESFRANPTSELGAPPKERAANNRMSAAGVPLLYVAGDSQTSIAEVRPSIGDQVVLAQFTSTEDLKFFDFTALESLEHDPISLFSPSFEKRTDRRLLLEYLHDLIARPVRASDTDYVMTQALAEYIRYCQYRFDGIAFRSVQRSGGGVNYVLFDKSSLESIQNYDWKPEFSLETSVERVSVHNVGGVNYTTYIVDDRGFQVGKDSPSIF